MEPERRRQIVLVTIVVVLGVVIYQMWPRTSAAPAPSSNGGRRETGTQGRATQPAETAPDVHLDVLQAERPRPEPAARNLFRFRPKPPPPPPTPNVTPSPPVPVAPVATGPPPVPPPPPITLKFIGLYETADHQKVAVLSDGRGTPVSGKEGQTVLGQYRILRIGVESIEMSYLDGRGRQTIRLTGS